MSESTEWKRCVPRGRRARTEQLRRRPDAVKRSAVMTMTAVTADQMREIDRIMVEDLHIELVQMMENAGRNLADLAQRRFRPTSVLVIAGVGGNGGGGLVAARHLANRGLTVSVVASRPESVMTAATA